MRPIDAEVFQQRFEGLNFDYLYDKRTIVNILKTVPTIDAVPVVRCKDCKWFRLELELGEIRIGTCPYQPPYEHTHGEGYCFRGVRRESEVEDNG